MNKIITLFIVCLLLAISKALLIILALAALGLALCCLAARPKATLLALALIPITCLATARPGLCILMIAVITIVMIAAKSKPKPIEAQHLLIKDT